MATMTITRFTANPAAAEEVRARHATLVAAIRSAAGGLTEARLGRLDDRSWVGVWRWESAEHLLAARRASSENPAAVAAFALVTDVTGEDIDLVDER